MLDGGIRRGSDVVKAVALGARAVMIGRAYLWGLAANGQAGVENVLDILRGGIDSALLGLGHSSIHDLGPDDVIAPDGFFRTLGPTLTAAGRAAADQPQTSCGGLDDQPQLGELLVEGERVALDGGGEAALRGEAELVERDVLRGLVDPALEGVLVLERAALGGDQAEHDLLALRHEPQRLEATGALVVVLQEEAVDGELGEQRLGDEVVAALGRPRGAVVAAAHVRGHVQPLGPVGDRGVDGRGCTARAGARRPRPAAATIARCLGSLR